MAGSCVKPRLRQRRRRNELAGKYWRSVITTGEPESAYRRDANRYPMNDILRPFELTAGMCRMHWMSIVYWARRQQPEELRSRARPTGWFNPIAAGGVHGGSDLLLAGVLFAAVIAVLWLQDWGLARCWAICWPGSPLVRGARVYQRCG